MPRAQLFSHLVLLELMVTSACGGDRAARAEDLVIQGADTLIGPESGLLAQPSGVSVDENGIVYALDFGLARVVRYAGTTAAPTVFGRKGHGPGEFETPAAISADTDTVRVVDPGSGRVQVFAADGQYIRSYASGALATAGRIDIAQDGRLAVGTQGLGATSLVILFDREGRESGRVGTVLAESGSAWDISAIKQAIAARRVPDLLRNAVLPRFAPAGRLWLVYLADGLVQQYDSAGRKVVDKRFTAASMQRIKEAFFERNARDQRPFAFYPLQYFSDAVSVEQGLWLLLNLPDGEPREVLVLGADGVIRQRLFFPGLTEARRLAVDRRNGRVYFATGSSASVVSVRLPSGPLGRKLR